MKLFALLWLCAVQLQAADGTSEVKLGVGQKYTLDLPSNPTTGYRWVLIRPTNQVFTLITNTYEPGKHKEGLVGSGGVEHWTFEAVEKGRTDLALQYARSWEKDAARKTNVVLVCE